MKKIVALCTMVIALGFVTVGCGGGSKPAQTPAQPEATGSHEGHDHDENSADTE